MEGIRRAGLLQPVPPIRNRGNGQVFGRRLPLALNGSLGSVGSLKLEIFSLCESAADYGGKLCIMGAFDHVTSPTQPHVVPRCAVVARIRFHRVEEGSHKLRVSVADADGRPVIPNVEAQVEVPFAEHAQSATFNLVVNINGLKLDAFGEYTTDIAVDGMHVGSLPLYFGRASAAAGPSANP